MTAFLHVVLPVPLNDLLTYKGPSWVKEGDLVHVPFGKRTLWGVVWSKGPSQIHPSRIKDIFEIHSCVQFSSGLRAFLSFMARYTMVSLGLVVKMALAQMPFGILGLYRNDTHTQMGTYSFLKDNKFIKKETFQDELSQGLWHPYVAEDPLWSIKTPLILNPEQQEAFEAITLSQTGVSLLEGVPGSGKTEVLLALCQEVWKRGQQVLILLPEIILAHQWKERLERYFTVSVGVWHSQLTPKMRGKMFEEMMLLRAPVLVGARSALCLPYPCLGLIVVDEEHEGGYKQSEGILYHGRDMAIARGKKERIPVVLASATPSLETLHNVEHGTYDHVCLKKRYFGGQLPTVACLPMAEGAPKTWISGPLRAALQETLDRGQQSLLFLNKRGYACLHLCYRCGYRSACSQCSTWLVVHKNKGLICHHCGICQPLPASCPHCHNPNLAMIGPGIERLAEEVQILWPQARLALLSSDHTQARHELLLDISHGKVDIIIGTQILAKGHHFPMLTCLGIVDTDFALADMDFRASERLFQLLYQVTGRAGREGLAGHVYLQTFLPEHPLFKDFQAYDWHGFVVREMERRRKENLPPFTRMACLTLSGKDEVGVERHALMMSQSRPQREGMCILGPAPAPINPLRGLYRWKFLIRAPRAMALEKYLHPWVKSMESFKKVRVSLDRDPYSFL